MRRFVVSFAVLLLVAGCGGKKSQTSSTTTWADNICSAINDWTSSVQAAGQSAKDSPTKATLQGSFGSAQSATKTLVSDLKAAGKPDTQAGQQAKESLDNLSTNLSNNVDAMQTAVDSASGVSGVLNAITVVSGMLATMGTEVKSTFSSLEQLDAKGELETAFQQASSCDKLRNP
jgi:uncharacterized protein YceK